VAISIAYLNKIASSLTFLAMTSQGAIIKYNLYYSIGLVVIGAWSV
jgi:hypothetical protein